MFIFRKRSAVGIALLLVTIFIWLIFRILVSYSQRELWFTQYRNLIILGLLFLHLICLEGTRYLFHRYWPIQDISIAEKKISEKKHNKTKELKRRLPVLHREITEKTGSPNVGLIIKSVDYSGEEISVWPPEFAFTKEKLALIKEMRNKFGSVILTSKLGLLGYKREYESLTRWNILAMMYLEEKRLYKGFILIGKKTDGSDWKQEDVNWLIELQKNIQKKIAEIVLYQVTFKRLEKYSHLS